MTMMRRKNRRPKTERPALEAVAQRFGGAAVFDIVAVDREGAVIARAGP